MSKQVQRAANSQLVIVENRQVIFKRDKSFLFHFADSDSEKRKASKRGKVSGFSKKSRFRMGKFLCRFSFGSDVALITLTYDSNFPTDYSISNDDLDNFKKRVDRRWPDTFCWVWKREPQKRGAPHFHLFVPVSEHNASLIYSDTFRAEFSALWSGDDGCSRCWDSDGFHDMRYYPMGVPKKNIPPGDYTPAFLHAVLGVDIRTTKEMGIESSGAAEAYTSKYICKLDNHPDIEAKGRWWGVYNKKLMESLYLPSEPVKGRAVDAELINDFYDYVRVRNPDVSRHMAPNQGFTLLGSEAVKLWSDFLDDVCSSKRYGSEFDPRKLGGGDGVVPLNLSKYLPDYTKFI